MASKVVVCRCEDVTLHDLEHSVARGYRDIKGDPLRDPNRHARVQPVRWRADGMPDFGAPRPDDTTPSTP